MTRLSTRKRGQVAAKRDDSFELEVPVFKPTLEEFKDFNKFVQYIETTPAAKLGLVKVIPPKESWSWKMTPDTFENNPAEAARMIKPIKQFISGRKGSYRLDLMESKRRTVQEFEAECVKHDCARASLCRLLDESLPHLQGMFVPDSGGKTAVFEGKFSGEKTSSPLKPLGAQANVSNEGSFHFDLELVLQGKDAFWKGKGTVDRPKEGTTTETLNLHFLPVLISAVGRREAHVEGFMESTSGPIKVTGELSTELEEGKENPGKPCSWELPYGKLWLSLPAESTAEADEDPFDLEKVRNYHRDRDFAALETDFWASMSESAMVPLYGGDQTGTIFGEHNADTWNLNALDTMLRVGFGDKQAKGISTSMLYFGMWRAMFAWHTEDMELNSINFVHHGAPKVWYCIPPEHATRFESVSRAEFGAEANICPEFMRHKNVMISPHVLKRDRVPFVRAIQYPGEFMITFPRSYHGGFNAGFNVAEAVNFATPRWLDYGRKARWCKCEKWTFRLDFDQFIDKVRQTVPHLLPSTPIVGERVLLYLPLEKKEVAELGPVAGIDEDEKDWHMFRLKNGRRKGTILAVPLDKKTCPYAWVVFEPELLRWKWPFEEAAKKDDAVKQKSRKRARGNETTKRPDKASKRLTPKTPEDLVDPLVTVQRQRRWERLRQSRKLRKAVRHAQMFLLVQRDPTFFQRMAVKLKAVPPPLKRTHVLLDSVRRARLERLKASRPARLAARKEKVSIMPVIVVAQVLGDLVNQISDTTTRPVPSTA